MLHGFQVDLIKAAADHRRHGLGWITVFDKLDEVFPQDPKVTTTVL